MIDNKILKKIVKSLIDAMIPESQKYNMPSASQAINLNLFCKKIEKKKLIQKEIKKIVKTYNLKYSKKDYCIPFNKSLLESEIGNYLLNDYFTSKVVLKSLKNKSKKFLFGAKKDKLDELKLIKIVKKNHKFYEVKK